MSSGNQVPLGRYGATNRTCSKSSLILYSVCACRLTWGNAYLRRPWCQLCASASVPSVASDREQNHWAVGGYCGRSVTQEHSGTVPSPPTDCAVPFNARSTRSVAAHVEPPGHDHPRAGLSGLWPGEPAVTPQALWLSAQTLLKP